MSTIKQGIFESICSTRYRLLSNIFETKEDQGPLTFLPAEISAQVQRSIGRVLGRVQDEQILEAGAQNSEIKLVGPPRSVGFPGQALAVYNTAVDLIYEIN